MLRRLHRLRPFALPALALAAGASLAPGTGRADVVAFAPVQDRAGDPALVQVVEATVRERLEAAHEVLPSGVLRDALRRSRIRDVHDATLEELRELAAGTGADWVLSVTLHESLRREPPRVTLAGRAWSLPRGAHRWAGLESASGLDFRRLLGMGVVWDPERLARTVAERLAADLLAVGPERDGPSRREPEAADLSPVAIIPLGSVTQVAGTQSAEAATAAVRAALDRHAVRLVPSGCVVAVLRRQRLLVWGGVPTDLGAALRAECGARFVITGQVEAYETAGPATDPDPRVGLALRLVRSSDGELVWIGGLERRGSDSESVFGLGRVRTRGALAERMTETLIHRLLSEAELARPRTAGTEQERTP